MKTPIIFGLMVLSTLALVSCSDTTPTTQTPTTPVSVAPTPSTSMDNSMSGMDHSQMDM